MLFCHRIQTTVYYKATPTVSIESQAIAFCKLAQSISAHKGGIQSVYSFVYGMTIIMFLSDIAQFWNPISRQCVKRECHSLSLSLSLSLFMI